MAHELNMQDPNKVLSRLDACQDLITKIAGTVQTTADIGGMGLKIGGLDATFQSLTAFNEPLSDATKIFKSTQEKISEHVRTFQANNSDITY